MANRTTTPKVLEIYPTELETEQIEPYITIANEMLEDIPSDSGLSDSRLAEIERWLTAHLIEITREPKGIEEEIGGDTRIKYSDVFGEGLKSTRYGQMVSQLDTSGALAALGKKAVSIKAITSFE